MAITITENEPSPHQRVFTISLHGTIITVTVTSTANVVNDWISSTLQLNRRFLNRLVVGFGVQWVPRVMDAPASTLQLCVRRRCLIYQLNYRDHAPVNLKKFLTHPFNTFVGFGNFLDRKKLKLAGLLMWKEPLNLREHVRTDDIESFKMFSVQEIVQHCLGIYGVRMIPEITMSDWGVSKLRDDQVLQVSLKAYCAFEIGKNMKAWEIL